MTGYGKAELTKEGQTVTIELKSVNNRFYSFNCKLPRTFLYLEDNLKKTIGNLINRGRIDLYINYSDDREDAKKVKVDSALAQAYIQAGKSISALLGIENDITAGYLLKNNDIIKIEKQEADEIALKDLVLQCCEQATHNLDSMRIIEGNELKAELISILKRIEGNVSEIKFCAPNVAVEYRQKLTDRITEVLTQVDYDESKMLNEVAFFADRSNIDEEIARLFSHISQLRAIFEEKQPIGAKMDYLMQEFNREANTICSKSNNITITNLGLALKADIEKLREQVQNIE